MDWEAKKQAAIDYLVDLAVGEGGAFAGEDPAMHRPHIAFELNLGQWVMMAGPNDGQLWGWASWYRVDDETLVGLCTRSMEDWIREQIYPDVVLGEHCYIATVIVSPKAPLATYRALINLAGRFNQGATSLCGHLVKRDGRRRFAQRFNDGSEEWWNKSQGGMAEEPGMTLQ